MGQKVDVTYRKATSDDIEIVTDLLCLLYNGEGLELSRKELLEENIQHFADSSQVMFLAFDGNKPVGISHGSLRREYVNGANDGLKGYLEAIYVLPEYRLNGIALELVRMIERWAAQRGCREMASDCLLDNTESYKFHLKIGYEETERNIFFLKAIEPPCNEARQYGVIIRIMTIDDYEQVYALWLNTPGMGLNDLDDSKDGIAKYLARNPNTCFIAEKDGKIVGAIMCGHDGRRGYIHHTAVDGNEQRHGIGTALVNAAMSALEGEGISKAVLVVFKTNEKGNAFWEKLGFTLREDLASRGRQIAEYSRIDT